MRRRKLRFFIPHCNLHFLVNNTESLSILHGQDDDNLIWFCVQINEIRKSIGPAANKFHNQFSDASVLRYLRARNHNTRRAAKMMKETLKWRQKYKPEMIRWVTLLCIPSSVYGIMGVLVLGQWH